MRIAVAGAGAGGRSIAQNLLGLGHSVLLIESRRSAYRPERVPDADWMWADACELTRLEAAGIEGCDVVIATTGDDKVNLVFSLLCKMEFGVPRTVDWDVPHDINPHSRPQIIGRLEDMGAFYREVADQLGQPLPSGFDVRAANRQTYAGDRSAWLTAEARDRIATIYAADFDWLGYDHGGEA